MKKVAIYWKDLLYYDDGRIHAPSDAYTEGILCAESSSHVYVKYPTTIITDEDVSYNHPLIKPKYCCIPRSLIARLEYYEA